MDEGSQSLYEYDTKRGRFLGPAVRLDAKTYEKTGHKTLPGYPTVVMSQPAHEIVAIPGYIAVAGAINGYVALVPWNRKDGLGKPRFVDIPILDTPDALKDEASFTKTDVAHLSPMGSKYLLAVTRNELFKYYPAKGRDEEGVGSWPYRVMGYLLDPSTGSILKAAKLSDKKIQSLAPWDNSVIAASGDQVLVIRPDLTVSRTFPIGRSISHIRVVSNRVILETYEYEPPKKGPAPVFKSARLLALDLNTGDSKTISTAPFVGPFIASRAHIWWAYGSGEAPDKLKHVFARDLFAPGSTRSLVVRTVKPSRRGTKGDCNDIRALVQLGRHILAPCSTRGRLARIPVKGGQITVENAGSFPSDIVLPRSEL